MSKKSPPTLAHDRYQDELQLAPAHPPSLGWFDLAKPARLNRKLKRGWKRMSRVTELLGLVALALVAAVLLVGVL